MYKRRKEEEKGLNLTRICFHNNLTAEVHSLLSVRAKRTGETVTLEINHYHHYHHCHHYHYLEINLVTILTLRPTLFPGQRLRGPGGHNISVYCPIRAPYQHNVTNHSPGCEAHAAHEAEEGSLLGLVATIAAWLTAAPHRVVMVTSGASLLTV